MVIPGIAMSAIVMSEEPDSLGVIRVEWQSER